MLSKDKIIEYLQESLKIEEYAVPLYTKHIHNTLFFSGFEKEKAEKIKSTLNVLAEDSAVHAQIILEMIEKIKEGGKDVY